MTNAETKRAVYGAVNDVLFWAVDEAVDKAVYRAVSEAVAWPVLNAVRKEIT